MQEKSLNISWLDCLCECDLSVWLLGAYDWFLSIFLHVCVCVCVTLCLGCCGWFGDRKCLPSLRPPNYLSSFPWCKGHFTIIGSPSSCGPQADRMSQQPRSRSMLIRTEQWEALHHRNNTCHNTLQKNPLDSWQKSLLAVSKRCRENCENIWSTLHYMTC